MFLAKFLLYKEKIWIAGRAPLCLLALVLALISHTQSSLGQIAAPSTPKPDSADANKATSPASASPPVAPASEAPTSEDSKATGEKAKPSESKGKETKSPKTPKPSGKSKIIIRAEILKSVKQDENQCEIEFQSKSFSKGDKVSVKSKKKNIAPSGFVTQEKEDGKRVALLELKSAKTDCTKIIGAYVILIKKTATELRLEILKAPHLRAQLKVGQGHLLTNGLHLLNQTEKLKLGIHNFVMADFELHPISFREDPGAFHKGLQLGARFGYLSSSALIRFDDESQLMSKSTQYAFWLGYRLLLSDESVHLTFRLSPVGRIRHFFESKKRGFYEVKLLKGTDITPPFVGLGAKFRLFSWLEWELGAEQGVGVSGKTDQMSEEDAYQLVLKQSESVPPEQVVEAEELATRGSLRSLKYTSYFTQVVLGNSMIPVSIFYDYMLLKGNVLKINSTFQPIMRVEQRFGVGFTIFF